MQRMTTSLLVGRPPISAMAISPAFVHVMSTLVTIDAGSWRDVLMSSLSSRVNDTRSVATGPSKGMSDRCSASEAALAHSTSVSCVPHDDSTLHTICNTFDDRHCCDTHLRLDAVAVGKRAAHRPIDHARRERLVLVGGHVTSQIIGRNATDGRRLVPKVDDQRSEAAAAAAAAATATGRRLSRYGRGEHLQQRI